MSDIFNVWLIEFNPADSSIMAVDWVYTCMSGSVPYYEFPPQAPGNYLVKAQLLGTVPGTSGYIPTYGHSSPHWDSATTIIHGSGWDTLSINMIYGTVPSGPGFISGYVISGAGKRTSVYAPAVNMLIYLKDAAGNILTSTTTDTNGNYSFSNLAYNTYFICPESYKYYTTQSAAITLTSTTDSAKGIDFKQHTTSGTITPFNGITRVNPVTSGSTFTLYPNPSSGDLILNWMNCQSGKLQVTINDITGRNMINQIISMYSATGQYKLDLSDLTNGIYIISLQSDGYNYTGKLEIRK